MLGGQANLDCKPGRRDKVKSSGGSAPASTHLPTASLLPRHGSPCYSPPPGFGIPVTFVAEHDRSWVWKVPNPLAFRVGFTPE